MHLRQPGIDLPPVERVIDTLKQPLSLTHSLRLIQGKKLVNGADQRVSPPSKTVIPPAPACCGSELNLKPKRLSVYTAIWHHQERNLFSEATAHHVHSDFVDSLDHRRKRLGAAGATARDHRHRSRG